MIEEKIKGKTSQEPRGTGKAIIFDSSTLINMMMNGLHDILRKLKKIFPGKFLITSKIKFETVDRPINNKQFELGALKVSRLIEEKVLELPESIGISSNELKIKTQQLLEEANHVFSARGEFLHIIDEGEASCLALSLIAKEKGIENIIAIDERTTRMLAENPENLQKLFNRKFHTNIKMFRDKLPEIREIKIIRSSELIYIAWKKKLVELGNGRALDALLYATKFKGSSISREEIEEIKRL